MGGISAGYVLLVKSKFYQQNIARFILPVEQQKNSFYQKNFNFYGQSNIVNCFTGNISFLPVVDISEKYMIKKTYFTSQEAFYSRIKALTKINML